MITYQLERFSAVVDEIKPLIWDQWEGIAINKEKVIINPNYELYGQLDDSGILSIVTVRDDGALVGYCIWTVIFSFHYRDHRWAIADTIYIKPSHRKGFAAARLLKLSESVLRQRGVSVADIGSKVALDFGAVLKRRGWRHIENKHQKILI